MKEGQILGSHRPTKITAGRRSRRLRSREYRTAYSRLDEALRIKDFSRAAKLTTNIALRSTPLSEAVNVLLAGIQAFREGQEKGWRPEPSILAESGINKSAKITRYKLKPEREKTIKDLLTRELTKVAKRIPGGS